MKCSITSRWPSTLSSWSYDSLSVLYCSKHSLFWPNPIQFSFYSYNSIHIWYNLEMTIQPLQLMICFAHDTYIAHCIVLQQMWPKYKQPSILFSIYLTIPVVCCILIWPFTLCSRSYDSLIIYCAVGRGPKVKNGRINK